MLKTSREAIDSAVKNPEDPRLAKAAEAAVYIEINRSLMIALVHVLADYRRKHVVLTDLHDPLEEQTPLLANRIVEKIIASRQRKGKPTLSASELGLIKAWATPRALPRQAMRVEFHDRIVIGVYRLDSAWLQQPYDAFPLVNNADVIHATIAHEVMGYMFQTDTRAAQVPQGVSDRSEQLTQVFAANQMIDHWIKHRSMHKAARFYAYERNREPLLDLLYLAAWEKAAAKGQQTPDADKFKELIKDRFNYIAGQNKHNSLPACPYDWGGLNCRSEPNAPGDAKPRKVTTVDMENNHCPHKQTCSVCKEK